MPLFLARFGDGPAAQHDASALSRDADRFAPCADALLSAIEIGTYRSSVDGGGGGVAAEPVARGKAMIHGV
jgi:hypothetical protein